jgi:ABC-type antimicrobial peptide transport system permease subunit
VFRPLFQECFSVVTFVARTRSVIAPVVAAIRKEVASVDQSLPVYNPRTVDGLLSASLAPRRFAMLSMGSFAGSALLLALVGIYGVLSCVISERTREIAIRIAVGARRRDVVEMVLLKGMRPVVLGGVIGLGGACALTRFLRSLLYGVSPTDPFTLSLVAFLIVAVALVACWLPARRAANLDPMEALSRG